MRSSRAAGAGCRRCCKEGTAAPRRNRRRRRLLELGPIRRSAGTIDRVLALRHYAFESHLAGVGEDGRAVAFHVLVEAQVKASFGQHTSKRGLAHFQGTRGGPWSDQGRTFARIERALVKPTIGQAADLLKVCLATSIPFASVRADGQKMQETPILSKFGRWRLRKAKCRRKEESGRQSRLTGNEPRRPQSWPAGTPLHPVRRVGGRLRI